MPPSNSTCHTWPTPEQTLLLRAALLRGDEVGRAWCEWKRATDLATLDLASRRLFPQLYRNLRDHSIHDDLMERFKEVFSRTYFQNHLLLARAAQALRALQKAEIPTMVLKGAALIDGYYGDSALRPMQDIDILVPRDQVFGAMTVLKRDGWRGTYHAEPEKRVAVSHAVPFADRVQRQLDLHWHVLNDCWHANDDRVFWERSVPVELNDVATRRLDPTDQLFHVCVHGVRWDDPPSIRWLADAMTVLRAQRDAIDWHRLIAEAKFRHVVLPLADGLQFMTDHLDAKIPAPVVAQLRSERVSRLDRFAYDIETVYRPRLSSFEFAGVLCVDFVRVASSEGGLRSLSTFARRTASRWPATPPWQLPLRLPARFLRRVANRAMGRRQPA